MAFKATQPFFAARSGNIANIVISSVILDVVADNVAVYLGDTVPLNRSNEYYNAWGFFYNKAVERHLLDVDGALGTLIYVGAPINRLTNAGLRITAVIADFTDDEVFIGIGADIVGLATFGFDTRNILKNAFDQLRDASLVALKDQAVA